MGKSKKSGFSFVEILVSIVLISILALGSYIVAPPIIEKAWDAKRKTDLHKIKEYFESYYSDTGKYPTSLPDCGRPLMIGQRVIEPFFPCDPTTKQPYFYVVDGDSLNRFRLYTILANKDDKQIEEIGCLGGCGSECQYNYGVSSMNVGLEKCEVPSYVCAPGGGKDGSCQLYGSPSTSECPKTYGNDSTCRNECGVPANRCKNASGKNLKH